MSNKNESSEVFDMSSFNEDGFADAKPFVKFDCMLGETPQNGPVKVKIEDIKLKKSEDGKMSVNWTLTILDGPQAGATAFKRSNITKGNATSYRYLVTDLKTSGIDTNDLGTLNDESTRKLAKGKMIAASVVVNPKDTRYYDIKLNKEVTA